MRKKKLKMNKVLTLVLLFAIAFSCIGIVAAYSGSSPKVVVEGDYIEAAGIGEVEEGGNYGALTNANAIPTYLDDGEWTAFNDVYVDDLEVADSIYLIGTSTFENSITQGDVTYDWVAGSCTDATTTVLSVVNPYGGDVYVDKFIFEMTNGTSTVAYTCGTTTSQYLSADPTDLLIDDLSVASSTYGTATATAITMNRIGSGSRSATSGFKDPGTNSEDIIIWGEGERIACFADTLYPGAFTEATNMFECTYKINVIMQ